MRQGVKNPEKMSDMPNIAFFAPLPVKIHKVVDGKEAMIELAGVEVDVESFLESQKPERRDELKKWLEKEKSWQSFVDFWAVDWDYESLKDELKESVFENEWQSFRTKKDKNLELKTPFKQLQSGRKKIAIKVVDIFGNDTMKIIELTGGKK